jgi:hypothetical protein
MQQVAIASGGISIVGTATGSGASSSYTVALPAGRQIGDFVLVITLAAEQHDAYYMPPSSHPTVTPGYTLQTTSTLATGYARSAVYWKRLSAADASLTVTNGSRVGTATVVYVLRGVHATTPFDGTISIAGTDSYGTCDPPAVTPTVAGSLVIAGAALASSYPGLSAAPAGYSTLATVNMNYAARLSVGAAMSSKFWAGGTENPAAYPGGGKFYHEMGTGFTITIRPA